MSELKLTFTERKRGGGGGSGWISAYGRLGTKEEQNSTAVEEIHEARLLRTFRSGFHRTLEGRVKGDLAGGHGGGKVNGVTCL